MFKDVSVGGENGRSSSESRSPDHVLLSLSAFTLVEILVVIAVIGILALMLFPVAKSMIYRANIALATSNIHQILISLNNYAADNSSLLPPNTNAANTSTEVYRLQMLYSGGYLTTPKVYVNPINAYYGRGLGQNIFGPGHDCYFSAARVLYTNWTANAQNVLTPSRVGQNNNIPVVWDQRADSLNGLDHVTTEDGRRGGCFGYIDGSVLLLGPPNSVIRGPLQ